MIFIEFWRKRNHTKSGELTMKFKLLIFLTCTAVTFATLSASACRQPQPSQNTTPPATTTPPASTPPMSTPPVTTPPVSTPPVTTPPVTTPPVTTPPVTTPPTPANNLGKLQANTVINARFYSIASLTFSNSPVVYPTQFTMPNVPISWNGTSFKGQLEEVGAGEDVLYQAAGNVSPNGATLISFVYSQRIIRTNNTGTFYRLTLNNLPVGDPADGSIPGWGTFKGVGADLQNYVTKIEYMDGPLSNGQINPMTTYDSTDWSNTSPGSMPTFSLAFQGGINAAALNQAFNAAVVAPADAAAWNTADKVSYTIITANNWKNYYAAVPPGADFGNYIYVLASIGQKPNPGYTVSIPYVQQVGNEIRVKIALGLPDPGALYAQVITYPVAVVSLNKADVGAFSTLSATFVDETGKQIAASTANP